MRELTGCTGLTLAILKRARLDAKSQNQDRRDDARRWLRSNDCTGLVALLGLAIGRDLDAGRCRNSEDLKT